STRSFGRAGGCTQTVMRACFDNTSIEMYPDNKMSKDIKSVINYLDEYLTRSGRRSLDAVEANAILAKAGLLSDSKDRLGKPFRDLLRRGLLPHAFQAGGKGAAWTIPHSSQSHRKSVTTNVVSSKVKDLSRLITTMTQ